MTFITKRPTINKRDRETLDFFKREKRSEFISNITARTNMAEGKLRKMSFKQLKELSKGLSPQANHARAVAAMTPPSTGEIIRNKRTANNDHREALIRHLLEKRADDFTREELENMGTTALEEAATAADVTEAAEALSAMSTPSTAAVIKNKRN